MATHYVNESSSSESLGGQIAVITGAGRGSGRATAFRLAGSGASLFLSDIDADTLEETLTDLKSEGFEATGGVFDASEVAEAERLITAAMDGYGRIDVLVNNAGANRIQGFPEVSPETWDWTIDLNLKGPYFIMQEAAKVMIEQKSGCIVNIASISAWGGMTFSPPYAVAKAGVVTMTVTAAAYLAKYGIRVNAVSPGIVDTKFGDEADRIFGQEQGLEPGEFTRSRAEGIPMGRLAEPEDVASAVAFLASPEASYITGENLTVGGGKARL